MRRDGPVVDDASALRALGLHHANGLLRTEEGAGEVDSYDRVPLLEGKVLHRDGGSVCAGIVKEKVEASELLLYGRKQLLDGFRVCHIRGDREHRGPDWSPSDAVLCSSSARLPVSTIEISRRL